MLRENGRFLKTIYTFGLTIFAIFFGLAVPAAAFAASATSPTGKSPGTTTPSATVPVTPTIVAPDDMKKYIQGLGGTIDGATNTAHLSGYIDATCSKLLRLDASGVPVNGKVIFAMYDLGGGLECLKKTTDHCKVNSNCLSFEKLDIATKHRMSRPFKSYVQVEKVNTGMKIALASSGHLSVKGDDSKLRKLEAGAGCDCDINPEMKGPFKPDQISGLKAVIAATNKAGGDVKGDPLKPKPIPEDEDESDSDGADPAPMQQPLPQVMHTKTPPGLQHVPTDQEMGFQVYQDMQPYMQMAQSNASSNTAYSAFIAQQTQGELGRIQQYRPNNYLLGNSVLPGGIDLSGSAATYQNSANDSLLLATPVIQPVQQFQQQPVQAYPYGYPAGYPIPSVPTS